MHVRCSLYACCCFRIVRSVTPPGLALSVSPSISFFISSVSLRPFSFPILSFLYVALSICASCFQLCPGVLCCPFLRARVLIVGHLRRFAPLRFCFFSCLLHNFFALCRNLARGGRLFRFFVCLCDGAGCPRTSQPLISQRGPTCPPPPPTLRLSVGICETRE